MHTAQLQQETRHVALQCMQYRLEILDTMTGTSRFTSLHARRAALRDVNIDWDKRDRYGRIVGKVWTTPESTCSKAECPKTLDATGPILGVLERPLLAARKITLTRYKA